MVHPFPTPPPEHEGSRRRLGRLIKDVVGPSRSQSRARERYQQIESLGTALDVSAPFFSKPSTPLPSSRPGTPLALRSTTDDNSTSGPRRTGPLVYERQGVDHSNRATTMPSSREHRRTRTPIPAYQPVAPSSHIGSGDSAIIAPKPRRNYGYASLISTISPTTAQGSNVPWIPHAPTMKGAPSAQPMQSPPPVQPEPTTTPAWPIVSTPIMHQSSPIASPAPVPIIHQPSPIALPIAPISREPSPTTLPAVNVQPPGSPPPNDDPSRNAFDPIVNARLFPPLDVLGRGRSSPISRSLYHYPRQPSPKLEPSIGDEADESAYHSGGESSFHERYRKISGSLTSFIKGRDASLTEQNLGSELSLRIPGALPDEPTSRPSSACSQRSSRIKETGWAVASDVLHVLEKAAGVHPSLKHAVSALKSCVDNVHDTKKYKQEYEYLADSLGTIAGGLKKYLDTSHSNEISESVTALAGSLRTKIDDIQKRQSLISQSFIAAALQDEDDIVECYRQIALLFQKLESDALLSIWSTTNEHLTNARLEKLNRAEQARHDSHLESNIRRRACTANTRLVILQELHDWATAAHGPKIYWMNGMAGTGKTTIAYSFCAKLESIHKLAASFFCCRELPECREEGRIIPTIAYQLARVSTEFKFALCEVLIQHPDVHAREIPIQFERLLREPLQKTRGMFPQGMVVVIDALDECVSRDGAHAALDAVLEHAESLPIKFFVTGRPEPRVRHRFGSQHRHPRKSLHLHSVEDDLIQNDIQTYLQDELGGLPNSAERIKTLALHANNLFIYAATAVRYIRPGDPSVDSDRRLDKMIQAQSGSTSASQQHDEIDTLYSAILTAALDNNRLDKEEIDLIRDILCTVICAREPMNGEALVGLLDLPRRRNVELALEPLRSVLHLSDMDGLVSTFHASFPDYMLNPSRSKPFPFDWPAHQERLAKQSFKTMKQLLRFNICKLESASRFDKDVPNFEQRVNDAIPPHLFYACRYWADHLEQLKPSSEILDLLYSFLSERLLFWMEVLNLKGCIEIGGQMLLQAYNWLEQYQALDTTQKLAIDARRFVVTFAANAVSRSTPHIYVSALPFWSTTEPVWKIYGARTHGLIKPQGTAMERRDHANVAVWSLPSRVHSIAVSSSGTRIASGSDDFLVRIWDSRSGRLAIGPLGGHTSGVTSVAFSLDDTKLASGSNDHTIRIWDVGTGKTTVGPLNCGQSCVTSVAFSPNGNIVISGSLDATVRVWDASNGSLISEHRQHVDSVKSIAFAPDGEYIVSGSDDCDICVWDSENGSMAAGPLKAHGKPVNSVAFSADGLYVASGSDDGSICVWDTKKTRPIASFTEHTDCVCSVAFSPDGEHLVSGSQDRTVRVWSIRDKNVAPRQFKGHADTVTSVAFTPDGTSVVSGSHDNTIRIWDFKTRSTAVDLPEGHTAGISSLAFSPDGNRIASSSPDHTVRLWDAQTGEGLVRPFKVSGDTWATSLSFSPKGEKLALGLGSDGICVWDAETGNPVIETFKKQPGWITCVAFSPDGKSIVSSSIDATLLIWNVKTQKILAGPLRHKSGQAIRAVSFSPSGRWVASGCDDGTVCVWDARNDQPNAQTPRRHTKPVTCLAYSPNGQVIASGSDDCTINVWNVSSNQMKFDSLAGHTKPINAIVFSADGNLIISGSRDRTIRVWDAHSGLSLQVLEGHTGRIEALAFSPKGTYLASGSSDRVIRIWDIGGISSHQPDVLNDWEMDEEGWVKDGARQVLLWVPNDLRVGLVRPRNPSIIYRRGSLRLDFRDVLLHESWIACYDS